MKLKLKCVIDYDLHGSVYISEIIVPQIRFKLEYTLHNVIR